MAKVLGRLSEEEIDKLGLRKRPGLVGKRIFSAAAIKAVRERRKAEDKKRLAQIEARATLETAAAPSATSRIWIVCPFCERWFLLQRTRAHRARNHSDLKLGQFEDKISKLFERGLLDFCKDGHGPPRWTSATDVLNRARSRATRVTKVLNAGAFELGKRHR
jgi:hypothetical protein